MKRSQIIFSILILALLIGVSRLYAAGTGGKFGGLSVLGWALLALFLVGVGFVVAAADSIRSFRFLTEKDAVVIPPPVRVLSTEELAELQITKYKGPDYPHPVIFPDRCIGCHACVEACPHDVLAIVDARAAVIAADQCMEDTSCQVVCPVNPKACIVLNTAKEIRSQPAPARDAATYQTNVLGCYIIGDVSGVPLIKNAVKEGAEVIENVAADLAKAAPEPKADFDVAIIGVGPGGASAMVVAHDKNLRAVGIEQEQILATINAYPKGKYIFFKPESTDWSGGLPAAGLGLSAGADTTDQAFESALGSEIDAVAAEQTPLLAADLFSALPESVSAPLVPELAEKAKREFRVEIKAYLAKKDGQDPPVLGWTDAFQKHVASADKDQVITELRTRIVDRLRYKIPGDQRERILASWLGLIREKGIQINEQESCKSVKRADDGDYFIVGAERGAAKEPVTYKARRVVLSIGLRGTPNKLRLPNEETIQVNLTGKPENKVLYSLSNPEIYKDRRIIIVGGGNSALEAAVDLVATRDGSKITPRPEGERNHVTLLVRSFIATNVKFGNKLQLYQCLDAGLLDVKYGVQIKELRETEAVISSVQTREILETIENDFVFALIGGERPDRFLESIGITIVK
jgi:thioredoxin reductase/ferredoxin-like protein FixX